jgi:trans-aconitate methyltransferase
MAFVSEHSDSSESRPFTTAEIYDKVAQSYDSTHSGGIDFAEDRVLSNVLSRGPDPVHVWDIGCGNGFGLRLCANAWAYGSYEGFDPSAEMLRVAKTRVAGDWHATWTQSSAQEVASRVVAPLVRPDLILMLYCTHFIRDMSATLRGILQSAASPCRVIIAAPTIYRLQSGRYDLAKLGFPVADATPHSMESLRDVAYHTRAHRCRVGAYSGCLSRVSHHFMGIESTLMTRLGLPLQPDFCFADLEYL